MIKLDRTLIERIHADPAKQAFVSGLVRAAKLAQTVVLAEGVEVWQEALWLQQQGVDLIQGFLLHRPGSVEDVSMALSRLRETADGAA